jgi:hypothetical protein
MNIITAGMPSLCGYIINATKDLANFEFNFQQILGLAKHKELERLCICMDVWNCPGISGFNEMRGQGAAEIIHQVDPKIPILIWEGRQFDPPEFPENPPAFQMSGKIKPITNSNELYIHYKKEKKGRYMINITRSFFKATLKAEDIQSSEHLQLEFI